MIVDDLADYAVAQQTSRLSADVLHHAKRTVIDWFSATVPGGVVAPATLLLEALGDEDSRGQAVTYPGGRRMSLRDAALVNATAAHTVEFDDIFRDAVYHPGCMTVAASLAASQARGTSGEKFLRGVVAGVEISTRIGVLVNPAHYRSWHTTGTVGTFGAAAAVSTVLGLDARQIANALATAATLAAGLRKAFDSDAMSKPLHAGHAAEAGALAALAASRGVTGVSDILEGPGGFGAAMSEGCDWSQATKGLGVDYNITRLTIKNHGCCGHTFAAIDGALALRAAGCTAVADIERIEIGTYKTALDVAGKPDPRTDFEAKFSIPFVVATALIHGKVRLDAFTDERLADPAIRQLMGRTHLSVDEALNAAFPKKRAAQVRIHMRSGEVREHYQDTRRGDPDSPLTDAELEEKFRELVSPVVGSSSAEGLLKTLWSMESGDPRSLVLAVKGAAG
jgi:2-methylcitrate dehydratase PrpD